MTTKRLSKAVGIALGVAPGILTMGQGAESGSASQDPILLPGVAIIGSETAARTLPASGSYIGAEELAKYNVTDVNRALRQSTGVYLREEDGFGLFPNISVRGVTTERSKAVTVMEDGILSAPAPYSSPSAYYSPNIGRMSGLEILKGSSQIKYGPHITGGAVNFLSTPIPPDQETYLKLSYGSWNTMVGHLWHGDVASTAYGRVGYLVEGYIQRSDGFKTIDVTPDFQDADDTGFTRVEPMIKLFWELPTANYQRIELKYGYSDLDADETYLGLSETDFRNDPYRRYAASRFDNIVTENHRATIRHIVRPTENLQLATTGYVQDFGRNWAKLHQLRGPNVGLSSAILDTTPGGGLAILRGETAGTLRVRNNSRDYKIYGVQSVASFDTSIGETDHQLELGLRYHYDEVDRFQWNVDYAQAANGSISAITPGAMGAAGDRIQESRAFAVYGQDSVRWNKLTLTPGIRFETVDQYYEQDRRRADGGGSPNTGDGGVDAVAGGIALGYDWSDRLNSFFGIHRGFSMPGPRSSIRNSLDEETSLSFELGSRFSDAQNALFVEAVLFHTAFNDLIVGGNLGGGGATTTENVGNIDSLGLELGMGYDPGRANGWAVRTPMRLAVTLTNAELKGDARNTDPESLFEGGRDGAAVPYIPDYQINGEIGMEFDKLGGYLSLTYVPSTFTTASNTFSQLRSDGAGGMVADSRVGATDSYFVADFSLRYQLRSGMMLFGGINNLFDREYVASRHPYGPRPGMPRFLNAGVEFRF